MPKPKDLSRIHSPKCCVVFIYKIMRNVNVVVAMNLC